MKSKPIEQVDPSPPVPRTEGKISDFVNGHGNPIGLDGKAVVVCTSKKETEECSAPKAEVPSTADKGMAPGFNPTNNGETIPLAVWLKTVATMDCGRCFRNVDRRTIIRTGRCGHSICEKCFTDISRTGPFASAAYLPCPMGHCGQMHSFDRKAVDTMAGDALVILDLVKKRLGVELRKKEEEKEECLREQKKMLWGHVRMNQWREKENIERLQRRIAELEGCSGSVSTICPNEDTDESFGDSSKKRKIEPEEKEDTAF